MSYELLLTIFQILLLSEFVLFNVFVLWGGWLLSNRMHRWIDRRFGIKEDRWPNNVWKAFRTL